MEIVEKLKIAVKACEINISQAEKRSEVIINAQDFIETIKLFRQHSEESIEAIEDHRHREILGSEQKNIDRMFRSYEGYGELNHPSFMHTRRVLEPSGRVVYKHHTDLEPGDAVLPCGG